ncbi:MAG TPA: hypothetical protein PK592_02010, partial [Candidatus Cloacimonas sp.]|nr:hypothetical protein [Candidatus Cloacimonas sp.]
MSNFYFYKGLTPTSEKGQAKELYTGINFISVLVVPFYQVATKMNSLFHLFSFPLLCGASASSGYLLPLDSKTPR